MTPPQRKKRIYKSYFERDHLRQHGYKVPLNTLRSRESFSGETPSSGTAQSHGSLCEVEARDNFTATTERDEQVLFSLQATSHIPVPRINEKDADFQSSSSVGVTTSESDHDSSDTDTNSISNLEVENSTHSCERASDGSTYCTVSRSSPSSHESNFSATSSLDEADAAIEDMSNPQLSSFSSSFSREETQQYVSEDDGVITSSDNEDELQVIPSNADNNDITLSDNEVEDNTSQPFQDTSQNLGSTSTDEVMAVNDFPIERGMQPFKRLQGDIEGKLKSPINQPVVASHGDILINALQLCSHHNFNHLQKTNVMKLINSIFGGNVVPDTRFLLDELLFSHEGIRYLFYCKDCSAELCEIDALDKSTKTVTCPNEVCKSQNNIGTLSEAAFFVVFDIPLQVKLLLGKQDFRTKLINPLNFTDPQPNVLHDMYDGECYRNFARSLDDSQDLKYLSFSLCVDGSPLFSSSSCSIWPCFLMLNELPIRIRMENLLVAGLWFGTAKAKMDLFLRPIVDHINKLSDLGFSINFENETWDFKAYLIACCVDSVARADVQCTHSHRGEFGCNWCLIPGVEWGNARRYPFMHPFHPERTLHQMLRDAEEAMLTKRVINGVKGPSQLCSARCFDIILSMILDYMHALAEGNGKKFLQEWSRYEKYIGGDENLGKIEKRIKNVQPPVEVRKYLRSLSCSAYWTGREWENWILFYSVPILLHILPDVFLKNWICLVQAAHLLLRSEVTTSMINEAHVLLIRFVAGVENLYGLKMMRYNVHIMLHLAENVKRWGPLFALSTFTFEHGNQVLKKIVAANNGIASQICRAISLEQALTLLRQSLSNTRTESFAEALQSKRFAKFVQVGDIKLLGSSDMFTNLTTEEIWHCRHLNISPNQCTKYSKLQLKGCIFSGCPSTKSRSDNSFAVIKEEKIVNIQYIVFHETSRRIWVVAKRVRVTPFMCPSNPAVIGLNACFLLQVTSIDGDVLFIPVHDLQSVYVSLKFEHGHFLSPIPNIYNHL